MLVMDLLRSLCNKVVIVSVWFCCLSVCDVSTEAAEQKTDKPDNVESRIHAYDVMHNGSVSCDASVGHNDSGEIHRYTVVNVAFARVSEHFFVAMWLLFVTIAKIGFHSSKRLSRLFPESCLLIIIGIVVGMITYFATHQHVILRLDTELFFLIILPPIIMEAGYFMPTRAFFDQLGTILLHAIVATLMNTVLIGFSLWGVGVAGVFGESVCLPMLHALLFASLLAAVDPVAVLAVFESIHVNQLLYIIVFGESLLNDGVAVVLYHMFSEFSEIGANNIIALDVILGVVSFFVVVVGAVAIGTVMGLAAGFTVRFTRHLRVMEPMLVVIILYLSYILAELFELSGILSCTFCGIVMRKYVEVNISVKSRTTIKYVLKMMASVAEAVIFMFLGISAVSDDHVWNTEFVLLTVAFCLVYRAAVVVVLNYFANQVRVSKLDRISQFVMAYGGLRGAIAFSLSVVLDQHHIPSRQLFITTTIVVVYFTNIVLGSTIKPLVKFLKVKTQPKVETSMNETVADKVLDHLMAGIETISKELGHNYIRLRFLQLNHKYIRPLITGCKPSDKVHSAGSHLLSVYKRLNEHDALTIVRVPTDPESVVRLARSIQSVASVVRNHSSSTYDVKCSTDSLAGHIEKHFTPTRSIQVSDSSTSVTGRARSYSEATATELLHVDLSVPTMTPTTQSRLRNFRTGTLAGGSLRERGGRDADNLPTHRRFRRRCVQQQQQQQQQPDNDVIADEGQHGHENPSYCAASQVTFHIGGGGGGGDDDDAAEATGQWTSTVHM